MIKIYLCTECGLYYKEEKWAERCKEWCSIHHSCNLEITRHSIERTE